MSMIRRFPGLHCLAAGLALLVATLGCKGCEGHDCGEHECDCECAEPDPGTGGEGGEAGAPSTGGEGGEAGGEPLLRPNDLELEESYERP